MLAKETERLGHPLGDEACGTEHLSRQHEAHNQTRGLDDPHETYLPSEVWRGIACTSERHR